MKKSKIKVLYISGIDDTHCLEVLCLAPSQKDTVFRAAGNVDILSLLRPDTFEVLHVVVGGMAMEALRIPAVDVVVNAVSNPDTSREALGMAAKIMGGLKQPVFNRPESILKTGRDEISSLFSNAENIVFPKTVRFQPRRLKDILRKIETREISFPFILREAGFHEGRRMQLVRNMTEIRELEKYAMDGRDFYAIEFIDFASSDGLYRKYRVVVVGGISYPRHMIISDSWNVHADDRKKIMIKNPVLIEEEKVFLENFEPFRPRIFNSFYETLNLDFFGVDFAYDSAGKMIIFEINSAFRVIGAGDEDEFIDGMINYRKPFIEKIKNAVQECVLLKAKSV